MRERYGVYWLYCLALGARVFEQGMCGLDMKELVLHLQSVASEISLERGY